MSNENNAGVDLDRWLAYIKNPASAKPPHELATAGDFDDDVPVFTVDQVQELVGTIIARRASISQIIKDAAAAPSVPQSFAWTSPPPGGQSHVLFDDGYAEGWAKAIDTVRAMLVSAGAAAKTEQVPSLVEQCETCDDPAKVYPDGSTGPCDACERFAVDIPEINEQASAAGAGSGQAGADDVALTLACRWKERALKAEAALALAPMPEQGDKSQSAIGTSAGEVRQYRQKDHRPGIWHDLEEDSGVEPILMQAPELYEFRTLHRTAAVGAGELPTAAWLLEWTNEFGGTRRMVSLHNFAADIRAEHGNVTVTELVARTPAADAGVQAEGAALLAALFKVLTIKQKNSVPPEFAEKLGRFMFRNGYRVVFNDWYLQAEPDRAAATSAAHLPGWERGIATVTMTGHQLREALEFINPDGEDDHDQLDDELTFGVVQHKDDDGKVAAGLCCWNGDTDGVLPLDGEPQTDRAAAKGAVRQEGE